MSELPLDREVSESTISSDCYSGPIGHLGDRTPKTPHSTCTGHTVNSTWSKASHLSVASSYAREAGKELELSVLRGVVGETIFDMRDQSREKMRAGSCGLQQLLLVLLPICSGAQYAAFRWAKSNIDGGIPAGSTMLFANVYGFVFFFVKVVAERGITISFRFAAKTYRPLVVSSFCSTLAKIFTFVSLMKMEATTVTIFLHVSMVSILPINAVVLKQRPSSSQCVALFVLITTSVFYVLNLSDGGLNVDPLGVVLACLPTAVRYTGDCLMQSRAKSIDEPAGDAARISLVLLAKEFYKGLTLIPLMIFLDWNFFPNVDKWFIPSLWVGAFICAGSVTKDLCVTLLGAHMTYITMALEIAVVFLVEILWLAPRTVGMHEIFLLVLILQEVLLHNAQTYDFHKSAALTRYEIGRASL